MDPINLLEWLQALFAWADAVVSGSCSDGANNAAQAAEACGRAN